MGVSENSVNPMVNDHYPVSKWLFHWEYTKIGMIIIPINDHYPYISLYIPINGG